MALRFLEAVALRQTAYSVEELAPGGSARPDNGAVGRADVARAMEKVGALLASAEPPAQAPMQAALTQLEALQRALEAPEVDALIYLGPAEYALSPALREVAIEVDFSFGDKDGRVGPEDLREARRRYGQLRGPVGWNRLLLTDELERQLYPEQTVRSIAGLRLRPEDWASEGEDPTATLLAMLPYLEDHALARSYAELAAHRATQAADQPDLVPHCEAALAVLGAEIQARGSVRPSITDVARIGAEHPHLAAALDTPLEMARRLRPAELLEPFLGEQTPAPGGPAERPR